MTTTAIPGSMDLWQLDHVQARARMAEMSASAAALARDPASGGLPAVRQALAWFESDFRAHMQREDRALLPVLEAAIGQWCALPGWMAREHDELRAKLRQVRRAADAVGSAAGAEDALAREVERLAALLAIHMQREDQWLLPIAHLVLVPAQWAAVASSL